MSLILNVALIYLIACAGATVLYVTAALVIKRSKRVLSTDHFADLPLTTD